MELDKFWTEEISRAIEALKMHRVDPADLERWKNFHENLRQTIESWKVGFLFLCRAFPTDQFTPVQKLPSGDDQTPFRNNECSSKVCPFSLPLASLY
jgi:hypothetical protein